MKKFKPFDKVLVRTYSENKWIADFYNYSNYSAVPAEHWTISGLLVTDDNILPYNEETGHLYNTVGEFEKWVPKKGEVICVRCYSHDEWSVRIFVKMHENKFVCIIDGRAPQDTEYCTTEWPQAKPYENPFLNN